MKHILVKKNNTVYLAIEYEDRRRTRKIILAMVRGWRAKLAYNTLNFKPDGWSEEVSRAYVWLNVLKIAKDKWIARKYLNILREMKKHEIHFWALKFSTDRVKAGRAWKAFYDA